MNSWQEKLELMLRSGMKYCFPPTDGKYPQLVEDEFTGALNPKTNERDPGFFDAIKSLLNEEVRRLFMLGYEAGYLDSHRIRPSDKPDDEKEIERVTLEARHNSWKSYDQHRKENRIQ